jgi:tetratricopeptide (TPR) repeat protein
MRKNNQLFYLFLASSLLSLPVAAQESIVDPNDPFTRSFADLFDEGDQKDAQKSAEDLVFEGRMLLQDDRPLDARTKLLLALQKEPNNIEAHLLLGGYYMGDVGHFRLALKYAKRAEQLFIEEHGTPPYKDSEIQQLHASIIYLISQVRLNLDDYKGALELLDKFSSYGYFSSWYPGTRAWVLMKLGRLDEAIQVARMGTLLGSEPGRTLNMLGILLSMKGERETALDVLKKATSYELSLGKNGQPATPLNNSGEVFKEIFADEQAENSWSKATKLPDGCEHVLPSLNLTLLYIDQLNLTAASKTLDSFESCVAQFPLRNGEEHRALVNLARGRIALHRGQVDKAIEHLNASIAGRQWFGKIGTDQEDLDAGARVSLGQALSAQSNRIRLTARDSLLESSSALAERGLIALRRWWTERRAKQILTEELEGLEDLNIRHTDSLIEYPTFGELLSQLPLPLLTRRLDLEDKVDSRIGSNPYYISYRAAGSLAQGDMQATATLISQALNLCRPQKDELLKLSLLLMRLSLFAEGSLEYNQTALKVFTISRAALRNHGFRLPLVGDGLSTKATSVLYDAGFLIGKAQSSPYTISYRQEQEQHILEIKAQGGVISDVLVRGGSLIAVSKKLADIVSVIENSQA